MTDTDFYPGQRVRCIEGTGGNGPHEGKTYTVIAYDYSRRDEMGGKYVFLMGINGGWSPERFEPYQPQAFGLALPPLPDVAYPAHAKPLGGEVRQVSSTGGEKGSKPERYDLIPWDAMDHVARVYGFGDGKYDDHNWRKGYNWSLSLASAFRHMAAFAMGEDRDPESGELHPAHAVFHMLALLAWYGDPAFTKFDNRYKPLAVITNGGSIA